MADMRHNPLDAATPPYVEDLLHPIVIAGSDRRIFCPTQLIDWPQVSDFECVGAASDEAENTQALQVSAASKVYSDDRRHSALYVIDDEDGRTKIGIGVCPARRVAAIQSSNPSRLTVRALFWFYDSARAVEQEALAFATDAGARLRGEWVSWDWFTAACEVSRIARDRSAKLATSSMWLANRMELIRLRGQHIAAFVEDKHVLPHWYVKQQFDFTSGCVGWQRLADS